MSHQHPHDSNAVKTPTDARQGARGLPVLWVLIGGLALAILALLYFVSTGVENPPPNPVAEQPVGPSSDTTPGNAEPSRLDAPPSANQTGQ
ncbi:hypothetical protein [Terrihabitans sp. B22-R8]|uniref:hypothetical protein n=1 Tax=Terrihabitans sp. B22-R8 TaxID=3425128 RepID=UPI00403C0E3A